VTGVIAGIAVIAVIGTHHGGTEKAPTQPRAAALLTYCWLWLAAMCSDDGGVGDVGDHGDFFDSFWFCYAVCGPMLREFSAGAVVLRHMKEQWWLAVIEPGREGEPEDRKHVAALPKGNIDAGEKPVETALREVREETGLHARPIVKLADIKYVYTRSWADQEKVFKIVSFFLMKYQSGHIGDIKESMRHEVRRAYWMPLDQAVKQLSYKGERDMAAKALAYVEEDPEGLDQVAGLG